MTNAFVIPEVDSGTESDEYNAAEAVAPVEAKTAPVRESVEPPHEDATSVVPELIFVLFLFGMLFSSFLCPLVFPSLDDFFFTLEPPPAKEPVPWWSRWWTAALGVAR